jgi:PAS domain S-box-containing protein
MLGYAPDEMRGLPLLSLIDERGRGEAGKMIERLKHGLREHAEFTLAHRDGSLLRATFELFPVAGGGGDYMGFLAVGRGPRGKISGRPSMNP